MAKDRNNIRIYGDDASGVWVAPKGTTPPTAALLVNLETAYAAPWGELGWLSEDGVAFDQKVERKSYKAHQGAAIIRKKVTSTERTFTVQCLEETARVMGLAHPGATFAETSAGSGIWKATIPAGVSANEKAFIIREVDGTAVKVYVIPSGEAVLTGKIEHKNEDLTIYEFEIAAYDTVDVYNNSTAMTVV